MKYFKTKFFRTNHFFANQIDLKLSSVNANDIAITAIISPTKLKKHTKNGLHRLSEKPKKKLPHVFLAIFMLEPKKQFKNQMMKQKIYNMADSVLEILLRVRFYNKFFPFVRFRKENFRTRQI